MRTCPFTRTLAFVGALSIASLAGVVAASTALPEETQIRYASFNDRYIPIYSPAGITVMAKNVMGDDANVVVPLAQGEETSGSPAIERELQKTLLTILLAPPDLPPQQFDLK